MITKRGDIVKALVTNGFDLSTHINDILYPTSTF
jgi:hypothetical protein